MSPSRRRASARCAAWHLAPPRRAPLAALHPRAPLCAPLLHPLITRAARWGHRALPPLHPQKSPPRRLPRRTRSTARRIACFGSPPPPPPCSRAHAARPVGNPQIARGGSPPLCSYTSRPVALCVPLCLQFAHYTGGAMVANPRCIPCPPFPSSCGLAVGHDGRPPPPVGAPHPPGSPHASLFLVPFGRI